VAGVLIWLRADKLAPPKVAEEPAHGGDHGGHGHH
jgi:hypothetical protein